MNIPRFKLKSTLNQGRIISGEEMVKEDKGDLFGLIILNSYLSHTIASSAAVVINTTTATEALILTCL